MLTFITASFFCMLIRQLLHVSLSQSFNKYISVQSGVFGSISCGMQEARLNVPMSSFWHSIEESILFFISYISSCTAKFSFD